STKMRSTPVHERPSCEKTIEVPQEKGSPWPRRSGQCSKVGIEPSRPRREWNTTGRSRDGCQELSLCLIHRGKMVFGHSRCNDLKRNTKTTKVTGKLTDVVGFDIRRREANGHQPGVSHDTKLWSYGGDMKGHAVYEGFNWVRQVHSPQIGYRHSETAV